MAAPFSTFDYLLFLFGLGVLVGIGVYFRRDGAGETSGGAPRRSCSGFASGVAATRTLMASLPAYGLVGEAYFAGYKLLLVPALVWCCWPLLTRAVLPLYLRLNITNIYDYLVLRFDRRVGRAASWICVAWRFAWLVGILSAAGLVLSRTFPVPLRVGWVLVVLGGVYTLYTALGGLRSVVWAGVGQGLFALGGLGLVILTIWFQTADSPRRIAAVASALGRTSLVDVTWNPHDPWSCWTLLPHCLFVLLTLNVADQATLQHYLAARNLVEARKACTWGWLYLSLFIVLSMYAGVALLAFYHDHPQSLRAVWVANLDLRTGQAVTDPQGIPLVPWNPLAITPENITRLVAERRLLRPNTNEPFDKADDLRVASGGEEQVNMAMLAKRKPPARGLQQGEVLLHAQARRELFPHWIGFQTNAVVRSLSLAALVVLSLLSFDASLMAIGTVWPAPAGKRSLPAESSAAVSAPGSAAPRPVVRRALALTVGALAILGALAAVAAGEPGCARVLQLVATGGGPLLAVSLLGMFTRRATAAAAWWALLAGSGAGLALVVASPYTAALGGGRGDLPLQANWLPFGGFLVSLLTGFVGSLLGGRRKSREELRGLVAGVGRWGVCRPEPSVAIPTSFDEAPPARRGPETAP